MNKPRYKIHLEAEPEGGYTVTVPALRGCVTWGRDQSHAVAMAQEAIEGFLEALVKAGQPIPAPDVPATAPFDVPVEVKTPAV